MKSFGRNIPGILFILALAVAGSVAARATTVALTTDNTVESEGMDTSSDGIIEAGNLSDPAPEESPSETLAKPAETAPPTPTPAPPAPDQPPAPAPTPAAPTATVDGRDGPVKLRSTPGGQVLASVPGGSVVTLLGNTTDAYLNVSYNGTAGYMSRSYLKIN